jgi:hypothetical protein
VLHEGFIVLSLHFRCYDVARETFEFYGNPSNSDSELERERMDERGSMTMIWSDECVCWCWKSPCPACLGHIHMHESHEQMVSTSNPTGRPQHKALEPGKPLKINLFVGLRNIHISSFIIENQWNSCPFIWYQHQCQKIFVEMNHWLIIDLFVREVTITLLASPCSATFVWAGSQMCWRPGHPWRRLTGWCVDMFGGLQVNRKTVRNVFEKL